MIQLSDEILNKFIDGELDQATMNEVRQQLKNSEADTQKLSALQNVHRELGNLKLYEVSNDFTSKLLFKLKKNAKASRKDRFFIFSISSIFIIGSLIIIGLILSAIAGKSSGAETVTLNIDNYVNYFASAIESIRVFLNAKNISIIGSIFSFGIIISGYVFFENLRQTKRRLSKQN